MNYIKSIDHNAVDDPLMDKAATPYWALKGTPRSSDVGEDVVGLSLLDDELALPAAILKTKSLERNRTWMREFLADTGVKLCPHGKTTMAPDLLLMQMEDGAWGLTAATAHHVRIYRRFGITRIILANQLVGKANIEWIVEERRAFPEFEFYCLVDSLAAAQRLSEAVTAAKGAPIPVLLELGRKGGRTGLRTADELLDLAVKLRRLPGLRVAGVETFEGVHQGQDVDAKGASSQLETARGVLQLFFEAEIFDDQPVIFSAGGSAYFDLAVNQMSAAAARWPFVVPVLRSGCYITHDAGIYQKLFSDMRRRDARAQAVSGAFEPALEVWAHVQSIPEPGVIIASLGRRDVGSDAGMPQLVGWAKPGGPRLDAPDGVTATALWDQHLKFHYNEPHEFEVGDLLGWGVSHPCTTFDKWRALFFVDDKDIVTGLATTYF